MGNTNFQTIHQMGGAISDLVKQATGRDDLQNIDMEHITVAQNHHYEEIDLSGQVVSFQAGEAGLPFEKLDVQIKPVQDLHGYDSPWPAGGGKNILPYASRDTDSNNGVTWIKNDDGSITFSGTCTTSVSMTFVEFKLPAGEYLYSNEGSTTSYDNGNRPITYIRDLDNAETLASIGFGRISNGVSFTLSAETNIRFYVVFQTGNVVSGNLYPMVRIASVTDSSYSPYSNICPITGWTMVNVYQAGENMEDARVFRFPFPSEAGIVYGGTLDAVTGVLTVDRADVVYDGSMDENWLLHTYSNTKSFRTVIDNKLRAFQSSITNQFKNVNYAWAERNYGIYSDNDDPACSQYYRPPYEGFEETLTAWREWLSENPLTVVYRLADPLTYHLTPQQITTLLGQNYIWADTGDIEVKFTNVKEMY